MESFRNAVVAVTGDKVANGDVISFEVGPDGSIDVYASMNGAPVKKSASPIVDKVRWQYIFKLCRSVIVINARPIIFASCFCLGHRVRVTRHVPWCERPRGVFVAEGVHQKELNRMIRRVNFCKYRR